MEHTLKLLLTGINSANFNRYSETEELVVPISLSEIRENLQKNGKETLKSCLEECGRLFLNNYNRCIKDLVLSESFHYSGPEDIYLPSHYYVKKEGEENNVYKELDNYIKNIMNSEHYPEIRYITGGRGIGKTTTMNVLLRENIDKLFENKIIFIRCDIKKYIDLKQYERETDGKNPFEIYDYVCCQFLYILCEQMNLDFYRDIYDMLKDEIFDYRESKDFYTDDPVYRTGNIGEQLKKYRDLIIRYKEDNWDKKDKNYARQVIIMSQLLSPYKASSRAYDNWMKVSSKVRKILHEKEYKFWIIVDGIDNINRQNNDGMENRDFAKVLHALDIFEKEWNKISTVWFIMRNNTFEIHKNREQYKKEGSPANTVEPIRFTINRYVSKDAIIEKRKEYFNIRNYLTGIFEDSEPIPSIPTDELIVNSHHTRNYIYNWINYLFWHKVNKYYKNNKYLYYANLLLNDRLFLETGNNNVMTKQNDDILFNIFYYKVSNVEYRNIWHGLSAVRIMQYIKYCDDHAELKTGKYIDRDTLFDKLSQIFNYERQILEKMCEYLIVYGFIRYKDNGGLTLKVTNEGRYLIDFISSHVDILYYCALDTPLPKSCVSSTFKFITAHSNNERNYAESCVNTTTTFLKFLDKQFELEKHKIKDEQMKNIFYNPLDDPNITDKIHRSLTILRSSISNM